MTLFLDFPSPFFNNIFIVLAIHAFTVHVFIHVFQWGNRLINQSALADPMRCHPLVSAAGWQPDPSRRGYETL